MAGTGPRVARTPLELLNSKQAGEPPLLSKYLSPLSCALVGFCCVAIGNYATRRPMMSGIQKHIIAVVGGATFGQLVDNYRNGQLATRDAILRHYIELHPDDFPPYERKLFRDVFHEWVPIR